MWARGEDEQLAWLRAGVGFGWHLWYGYGFGAGEILVEKVQGFSVLGNREWEGEVGGV